MKDDIKSTLAEYATRAMIRPEPAIELLSFMFWQKEATVATWKRTDREWRIMLDHKHYFTQGVLYAISCLLEEKAGFNMFSFNKEISPEQQKAWVEEAKRLLPEPLQQHITKYIDAVWDIWEKYN